MTIVNSDHLTQAAQAAGARTWKAALIFAPRLFLLNSTTISTSSLGISPGGCMGARWREDSVKGVLSLSPDSVASHAPPGGPVTPQLPLVTTSQPENATADVVEWVGTGAACTMTAERLIRTISTAAVLSRFVQALNRRENAFQRPARVEVMISLLRTSRR